MLLHACSLVVSRTFFLVHTRMIRLRFLVLVASALPAVASVVVRSATTFGQQLIAICSLWCTSVMTHGANNMTTIICLKTEKFHKLISVSTVPFWSPPIGWQYPNKFSVRGTWPHKELIKYHQSTEIPFPYLTPLESCGHSLIGRFLSKFQLASSSMMMEQFAVLFHSSSGISVADNPAEH